MIMRKKRKSYLSGISKLESWLFRTQNFSHLFWIKKDKVTRFPFLSPEWKAQTGSSSNIE